MKMESTPNTTQIMDNCDMELEIEVQYFEPESNGFPWSLDLEDINHDHTYCDRYSLETLMSEETWYLQESPYSQEPPPPSQITVDQAATYAEVSQNEEESHSVDSSSGFALMLTPETHYIHLLDLDTGKILVVKDLLTGQPAALNDEGLPEDLAIYLTSDDTTYVRQMQQQNEMHQYDAHVALLNGHSNDY